MCPLTTFVLLPNKVTNYILHVLKRSKISLLSSLLMYLAPQNIQSSYHLIFEERSGVSHNCTLSYHRNTVNEDLMPLLSTILLWQNISPELGNTPLVQNISGPEYNIASELESLLFTKKTRLAT